MIDIKALDHPAVGAVILMIVVFIADMTGTVTGDAFWIMVATVLICKALMRIEDKL